MSVIQMVFYRKKKSFATLGPQGGDVHGSQELLEVEVLFCVLVAEDPEDGVDEGHGVASGKQVLHSMFFNFLDS